MANILIETVNSIGGLLEIEIWSDDLQHAIEGHPEVTLEKVKGTLKDLTAYDADFMKTGKELYSKK